MRRLIIFFIQYQAGRIKIKQLLFQRWTHRHALGEAQTLKKSVIQLTVFGIFLISLNHQSFINQHFQVSSPLKNYSKKWYFRGVNILPDLKNALKTFFRIEPIKDLYYKAFQCCKILNKVGYLFQNRYKNELINKLEIRNIL